MSDFPKDGIINIYKDSGYTSFDVVAKLRGILKIRKIGHTGTLDPMATGVLPICVGKGTKVVELLTDKTKSYETIMQLGLSTDTYDITGKVISESETKVSDEEIENTVRRFVGEISQVPPMYSAKKVGGKKLYELAREGIEIERKPERIKIYSINILSIDFPFVRMEVECSKGTYIRSLCNDIGAILNTGACMKELIRTRVGDFKLDRAFKLTEIENMVKSNDYSFYESIDSVFNAYEPINAAPCLEKLALNGNPLKLDCDAQRIRLYLQDGRFVGIYKKTSDIYKPEKMFI